MPGPPTPATFSTGETLTAAKLNRISQVVNWITSQKPYLRVQATTTQSVSTSTWTTLTTFDTLVADTEGGWNAGTQQYTVAVTGLYIVQSSVAFVKSVASGTFIVRVRILKNGNGLNLAASSMPHTNDYESTGTTTSVACPLTAGDVITVQCFHDLGSSLSTDARFAGGENNTSFLDIACIRAGGP